MKKEGIQTRKRKPKASNTASSAAGQTLQSQQQSPGTAIQEHHLQSSSAGSPHHLATKTSSKCLHHIISYSVLNRNVLNPASLDLKNPYLYQNNYCL